MPEQSTFRFDSNDWVLMGNALNEVVNGFNVPDFEITIGASRSNLAKLLLHLHTLNDADELALGVVEIRSVRNALRETIRELGVEEFHTRTGYEVEQGETLLQRLSRALGE